MKRHSPVARAVLALLLALSIINGVEQAIDHLSDRVLSQRIFGALKVLVALLGTTALWRLAGAPHRATPWLAAWAALVAVLAGMAPLVFGGAPLTTAALSFAGSGLALAVSLIWWRRASG